jgi:hypothetical protein
VTGQLERTARWEPPPRPEWVQRIIDEGDCMDIEAVVPLDEASLLASATRSTGLSDFGTDEWREPFRMLVRSLNEDSHLHLLGRLRTRSEILQLLTARLQIEEQYRRNPEIDDEQITEPLFIIGQGRSGTSLLMNVLMANPDYGVAKTWEVMFPSPPPEAATYDTDPRIERGHRLIDQWNRVTPTLATMHEFAGDLPIECCQILGLTFMSSSWFESMGQVPSYQAYLARLDVRPSLEYHQRVLKLLQWRNPRRHWVLKDPMHLDRLPAILDVYPDARFIWSHRDPARALASTVSLIGTVQWGRSDHPFRFGTFEYVTDPEISAARFNAALDQLEAGIVPADRVHHMLYSNLVGDTLGAVKDMHASFGLSVSPDGLAAMGAYIDAHPRTARPPHRVNVGTEELNSRERQAFARYQAQFAIPYE